MFLKFVKYREFSVKEELREAKPPSIEGSVVAEHAHLSHRRLVPYSEMQGEHIYIYIYIYIYGK